MRSPLITNTGPDSDLLDATNSYYVNVQNWHNKKIGHITVKPTGVTANPSADVSCRGYTVFLKAAAQSGKILPSSLKAYTGPVQTILYERYNSKMAFILLNISY